MIDREEMEGISKSTCGLHGLMQRQNSLVQHAEVLEKRIGEDTENLDYTRREITVTQIGIYWAKTKALEELEVFIAKAVNGLHLEVLEALQEHNDSTGVPMTASDLKDKVLAIEDEDPRPYEDLSITAVVQEFLDAGLFIRGGPDHSPGLRGKLWTSVYDLRTEIADEEDALKKTGQFNTMPAVVPKRRMGGNVVALRQPNDS